MLPRSRLLGSSLFAVVAVIAGAAHTGCSSDSSTGGSNAADSGASTSDGGGSGNDASTVNDAGSSGDAATEAGGAKKFGESCSTDSECASNACFIGGAQSYCSFHCTAATVANDCPTPPTSGQCNNQGYCKK